MSELREILPRPARVAKRGRCAAGLCVKTMLAAARCGADFTAPTIIFNVEYFADTGKQTRNGADNILSDGHFKLGENSEFAVVGLVDAAFSVLIVADEAGNGISSFSGVCDQEEVNGPRNRELVAVFVISDEQFGVSSRGIEEEFNNGHFASG